LSEWILGLGGSDHDFSAALMLDCDIRVAIEQERLSRRKHGLTFWYESPLQRAIDYCLAAEGVSMTDVRVIVSSDLLPTRVRHDFRNQRLREFPHHLCHAASAYMMLPPGSKAGVLVYDGFGSIRGPISGDPFRNVRETFSFFLFGPGGYECVGRTVGLGYVEHDDFPTGVTNSIGMLYELVTGRVPFEAETMPQLCTLILHAEPPLPRSVRPDVPEPLEQVIMGCLRKDRKDRYANVAALATDLGVVGLLAVELFETDQGLLVNELAMRPHNSGHWTIEGARTSQFEQHLRAVLDYPMGDTGLTAPAVAMANVLGGEPGGISIDERLHHLFASDPGVKVHFYGKQVRPGRKIGHVTAVGEDMAAVRERATRAARWLQEGR